MIVPFDDMPDSARVWIYQASKELDTQDIDLIQQAAEPFLNSWAAHGAALKSAFKVLHNKFLIITVDESFNQASGCSIDASVGLVKKLEQTLHTTFFDRTKVCFMVGDEIFESPLTELKSLIQQGKITKNTLTFNNLVPNIKEMKEGWMVPAQDTWINRYF
ncbi:hypothetical protein N6H18_04295 [Reichenbachiella agarivorans]|uniref:ABC transporter ATPase n=1 Tax=Reichenbachiella agarivorans TaxID=2979464 RepID=A0ABY6CRN2_9BACT|nr:hypothetical protein [Reichenbachiella agarivorans]UXP33174.1 hypothetical protein N6H18_04295 [Reichenbachiella agarivorans]